MILTLDLTPEAYLQDKAARNGQAAAARALIADAIRQEASGSAGGRGIRLAEYGIDPTQAADLRARFAAFAGEWERPEMDFYDDYDALKATAEEAQYQAQAQQSRREMESSRGEISSLMAQINALFGERIGEPKGK